MNSLGPKKRPEDANTFRKMFSTCNGTTKARVHTGQGRPTLLTKGHSCVVGWLADRKCKYEHTAVTNPLNSCVQTIYIYIYIYFTNVAAGRITEAGGRGLQPLIQRDRMEKNLSL